MPSSIGRWLLGAYALAIPGVLLWEPGRQGFWTCGIAALPLLWVLVGFHAWRRACPLAWFARLGGRLGAWLRIAAGRAPARVQRLAPLIQLTLMIAALTLRHLGLNGDPQLLAGFLVLLAGAAAVCGLGWSGRTWCQVVCPVGLVERIYTEPAADPRAGPPRGERSGCAPCTACVSHCPDLDLARAHASTLAHAPRRWATLAWPGVVLGFYLVWRLESGGWEAYFSGQWAHEPPPPAGAGLPAWPLLPRWLWIPGLLLLCGVVSALALALCERAARALGLAARAARHLALGGAGALALGTFYLFAGQPTLRHLPPLARLAIGVLCAAAALWLAWCAVAPIARRAATRSGSGLVARQRGGRSLPLARSSAC